MKDKRLKTFIRNTINTLFIIIFALFLLTVVFPFIFQAVPLWG